MTVDAFFSVWCGFYALFQLWDRREIVARAVERFEEELPDYPLNEHYARLFTATEVAVWVALCIYLGWAKR